MAVARTHFGATVEEMRGCLEPLVLQVSRLHNDIEYLLSMKVPGQVVFIRMRPCFSVQFRRKIQPFLCNSHLLCSLTELNLSIRGNKLSYSPSGRCQFELLPPPMQSAARAGPSLPLLHSVGPLPLTSALPFFLRSLSRNELLDLVI